MRRGSCIFLVVVAVVVIAGPFMLSLMAVHRRHIVGVHREVSNGGEQLLPRLWSGPQGALKTDRSVGGAPVNIERNEPDRSARSEIQRMVLVMQRRPTPTG